MSEARLRKLKDREKQLKAQIQNIENRVNNEKRKEDTRRKILVGSVVLSAVQKSEVNGDMIKRLLDRDLVKKKDRDLFGLAAEAKPEANNHE